MASPSCIAARSPRRRANARSSRAASPSATASPGACCWGPAARPGNITLPVNIVVTDSKREKVTTDKMSVAVPGGRGQPHRLFLDRALGDLRHSRRNAAGRVRGVRRLRSERARAPASVSARHAAARSNHDFSASSACLRDRGCPTRRARLPSCPSARTFRIFSAAAIALSTAEARTSASACASARAILSSAELRPALDRLRQALARLARRAPRPRAWPAR